MQRRSGPAFRVPWDSRRRYNPRRNKGNRHIALDIAHISNNPTRASHEQCIENPLRPRLPPHYCPNIHLLCTLVADLSRLKNLLKRRDGINGARYWVVEFVVAIMFGGTQLQAKLKWKEGVSNIFHCVGNSCSFLTTRPLEHTMRRSCYHSASVNILKWTYTMEPGV